MAYSGANVLEADDKTIGALGVGLLFLLATGGLLGFISQNTTVFQISGFSEFILQFILAFSFLFILAIFANYKGLDVIQDYAYPIIKWSYLISMTLLIGGLAVFGLIFINSIIGIILLILAAVLAFLFIRAWPWIHERIKRAAEWLTISTTIVLNEPGMIVLSLIQSIVVGITVIVEAISLWGWTQYAEVSGTSDQTIEFVAYSIIFLYLWLALTVIYYFDGANTFISYARIHNKDPKVGQGLNAASQKFLAIVGYAFVSAVVTFITNLMFFASINMESEGRSSGNVGQVVLAIVLRFISSIVQWLYHMVSFFTLPSIIIRQNNTKAAMSESASLFRRTFWDQIISEMGYSYGANILYIVTGFLVSIGGFIYGYVIASAYFEASAMIVGIIMAIVALFFGLFTSRFFLKPLYTALVTTIYVYATEGPEALKMISEERGELVSYLDTQASNPKYANTGNRF